MSKGPRTNNAPSWAKWWLGDWWSSSLRRRLGTPSARGIYHELWCFLMQSPDPGKAVDSAGESYTIAEIASEIGARKDKLEDVIRTLVRHGRVQSYDGVTADVPLTCNKIDTEKSLPDHWKYKRLRAERSDLGCDSRRANDAPRQRKKKKKKKKITPPTPLVRGERKTPVKPEVVEAIFRAYPRRVGKADALKAISKAIAVIASRNDIEDPAAWLLERVQAFAKSPKGNDGAFTPHPATWCNKGRYDDDEKQWYVGDTATNRGPARIEATPGKYAGRATQIGD